MLVQSLQSHPSGQLFYNTVGIWVCVVDLILFLRWPSFVELSFLVMRISFPTFPGVPSWHSVCGQLAPDGPKVKLEIWKPYLGRC